MYKLRIKEQSLIKQNPIYYELIKRDLDDNKIMRLIKDGWTLTEIEAGNWNETKTKYFPKPIFILSKN